MNTLIRGPAPGRLPARAHGATRRAGKRFFRTIPKISSPGESGAHDRPDPERRLYKGAPRPALRREPRPALVGQPVRKRIAACPSST